MSTKTIVILGITGNQGGSVANVFLNEPGWRIRGISRDPSKPAAQKWISQNVEVVAGDLDDVESLKTAFKGAHVIFGTTDFWVHMLNPATHERAAKEGRSPNEVSHDLEIEQGKKFVDAAAATEGLERFVLSTLSGAKKWSKGKINFNLHFDCKWAAVEYLREKYPALAAKTSLLQLGIYASNWRQEAYSYPKPIKQADGSYKVNIPMSGATKFPIVDPVADTGALVKALVQVKPGKNVVGAGSVTSWQEWCDIWGKIHGVKCVFEETDRRDLEKDLGTTGREIADMFDYMTEFGFAGGDPDVVYPWDLEVPVKVTTIEQYLRNQDWSSILS